MRSSHKYALSVFTCSVGAIALGGCTSLKVRSFDGTVDTRRGIAYFLPLTQFETVVTWAAACDKSTKELSLAPTVEAKPKAGPDPDSLQVIDYRSLSAVTKTSNVKVEFYDNGAIKTINASADDRTGEILTSTLVAAGKIAKAVAFAGDDQITCSEPLISALEAASKAKGLVDKKTQELARATDVLTALNARVVREGGSLIDEMRRQHSKQIGEVAALQIELDLLKAKLADATKPIRHQEKTVFPSASDQFASMNGLKIPERVLAKWVTRKDGESDYQMTTRLSDISTVNSVSIELSVNEAFRDLDGVGRGKPTDGIRYRVAVPGSLKFCKGGPCTPLANDGLAGKRDSFKSFPVNVLHKGSTFFLPFESEAFTNGSLTATFSEAGVLTSAGYEQKKAQGEALASSFGTLADQTVSLVEAARENDKTELELIQEATALDKAKKERDDAAKALLEADPDPNADLIAALTASTALKQAELADLSADIALAEARRNLAQAVDGT